MYFTNVAIPWTISDIFHLVGVVLVFLGIRRRTLEQVQSVLFFLFGDAFEFVVGFSYFSDGPIQPIGKRFQHN